MDLEMEPSLLIENFVEYPPPRPLCDKDVQTIVLWKRQSLKNETVCQIW